MAEETAGTYEDWRVTGEPGSGFPPYKFVWSLRMGHSHPESSARAFIDVVRHGSIWVDGPHLSRRTVTIGEWSEVSGDG